MPATLMILGGSNCQLNGFKLARKRKIPTILADYTSSPVSAPFCDVHENISTFDIPACINAARKHKITGVMTLGTDQPVYTAAKISEALNLPSTLTSNTALAVTNKKVMKTILTQANIPTMKHEFISENSTGTNLVSPFVIKPLDSQGQRGVYRSDSFEEVMRLLPETLSYSRCNEALLEEFYESDELTVSGWVRNGELTILTITDRLHYPDSKHIGVCIGHRFPSIYMNQYEQIKSISDQTVSAFGLTNGPFYLQLLYGRPTSSGSGGRRETSGFVVNELACRIGGAFEDVIIPELTGFDILNSVMDCALGLDIEWPFTEPFRCDNITTAASVQLMFCAPGKIASLTPVDELLKLPFVLDAGYNYLVGDVIPKMENATARFGHAVIIGTSQTITAHIQEFYNTLKVMDTNGNSMIKYLYPDIANDKIGES